MKTRNLLHIVIILFLGYYANGQIESSKILKTFAVSDTLKIDSLSIVPQSFKIFSSKGTLLDTANYTFLFASSTLIIKTRDIDSDSVTVSYRTFPYDFSAKYFNKLLTIKKDSSENPLEDYYLYHSPKKTTNLFALNEFQKSGSISRGISAGNAQNLSVASDMNLQLTGMISPDLQLTAAITDNNIPIQPDGNTQQLQDFDQVFIKLDHKNGSLIAGDFVLKKPSSYFLNYHKKSQGALGEAHFKVGKKENRMQVYGGAAISRGNYNRYKFQGIEGNQGPYKLQGANFERYIVVLSGSEKVYMDGKLLTRGETNDYIINYNTAEVIFMPRILVTKDKRFEVEFEYSQQNYSRAMVAGGVSWEGKKFKVQTHIFSEGDMKNQPIDAPLTAKEKAVLSNVGDSLNDAIVPAIDSSIFNPNRVMYKMIDSLGFDSVFVYSTHSDSAFYQLSFSLVGSGNGNYIQKNTAANGRVFQWVTPVNGQPQGDYAPVKLLITPKKRQMITSSFEYRIGKSTKIGAEVALSIHDQNTFSSLDAQDNLGIATVIRLDDQRKLSRKKNPWTLKTGASYSYVQKDFNTIERFRSVEFDRDWNGLTTVKGDEHLGAFTLGLQKKSLGAINYQFSKFNKGIDNKGFRNGASLNFQKNLWILAGHINTTATEQASNSTSFLRHQFALSKSIKGVKIGLKENSEKNLFHQKGSSTLLPASYSFGEYGGFISSSDTSKIGFKVEFKHRQDSHSDSAQLILSSSANELIAAMNLLKNPKHRFRILGSYRNLIINDPLSQMKPDESARGRAEYRGRFSKGAILASAFYETNSGLEVKKEYSYIEVASGQGVYSWIDYNDNGIKELDEFQVAAFQDQANFIRILIPSSEYVKTYGSRFNTTLNLNPGILWRLSTNPWLKAIAHFSNNLTYRSQIKTQTNDFLKAFNPFNINIIDPKMVYLNSYFKNTFFFNRNNSVFGLDWTFKYNKNKVLMINGYEGRALQENLLKIRWNISRKYLLELTGNQGNKTAFSEFFDNRDFNIVFNEIKSKFTVQPNRVFRISANYLYSEKTNNKLSTNSQLAINNSLTILGKFNNVKKGNISASISYIDWQYTGADGDALAFEMLEGYRTGANIRWNISYNRTLMENLQLTVIYDGRKPAGTSIIHTGMVQIRAYF